MAPKHESATIMESHGATLPENIDTAAV